MRCELGLASEFSGGAEEFSQKAGGRAAERRPRTSGKEEERSAEAPSTSGSFELMHHNRLSAYSSSFRHYRDQQRPAKADRQSLPRGISAYTCTQIDPKTHNDTSAQQPSHGRFFFPHASDVGESHRTTSSLSSSFSSALASVSRAANFLE